MDYFSLQTRDYRKERKRKKKNRKKGEIKQSYGYMTFAWILVCFLYTNYLGMDC